MKRIANAKTTIRRGAEGPDNRNPPTRWNEKLGRSQYSFRSLENALASQSAAAACDWLVQPQLLHFDRTNTLC